MSEIPDDFLNAAVISEVRDPYPMFATMRQAQRVGVFDVPGHQRYHVVFRYDDVCSVLRDPDTYSSRIMAEVMGPVMGRTILEMDGRAHTIHRGLVSNAFRPKSIERYARQLVEPVVDDILDRIAAQNGRAELVSDLTLNYPLTIIAGMVGIEIADYPTFQQWSLDLISYQPRTPEKGLAASRALRAYLAPIVAERRREPREDLISELVAAEVEGNHLTDDEIFGFLLLLLPAGAETTFRLLGNVLYALLAHPDALELVRSDAGQLHWALEETLRWEPPLLATARMTTREVHLGGIDIPAGGRVSTMIGAANHDEEHYPDPDRFDINRHADDHLSFGLGKHFCLGYHLARLEVMTAVRAVLDRLRNIRLDPDQESYIQGMTFRSPNRLAVLFD